MNDALSPGIRRILLLNEEQINMNHHFFHTWGIPLLLAVLTIFGLLAALMGTGIWHLLAWGAMATPLLVIAKYTARMKR